MRKLLKLLGIFLVFVVGYGLGLWTWTQPWGPLGPENVERTIREELEEQGVEVEESEVLTLAPVRSAWVA